jgi:glycolate oxidase iron-sulfur subunit
MDSPRGRIYQMARVHAGEPITDAYREHIDLCLACRACESACPSGVPYGRLVEDARAEIQNSTKAGWLERLTRNIVFRRLLPSHALLTAAGAMLYLYQASGLQRLFRALGLPRLLGSLGDRESLLPDAEIPFFFREYGKTFPARGEKRYRVAFLGGCVANISFARLNEATVRVLQANGCEVVIPPSQTCCGALHVHAGVRDVARKLAKQNIDAIAAADFDAIITNAAGCGSTLKEYGELLAHDSEYAAKAHAFSAKMKDATEFLASIERNPAMNPVNAVVTYQDSCHLAHGQKVRSAPRELLRSVPGVEFREMPMSDACCGSAGIYNALHTDMSMKILEKKMGNVKKVNPQILTTANPGCMLQLRAGVRKWELEGTRVAHVIEVLDEAYRTGAKKA